MQGFPIEDISKDDWDKLTAPEPDPTPAPRTLITADDEFDDFSFGTDFDLEHDTAPETSAESFTPSDEGADTPAHDADARTPAPQSDVSHDAVHMAPHTHADTRELHDLGDVDDTMTPPVEHISALTAKVDALTSKFTSLDQYVRLTLASYKETLEATHEQLARTATSKDLQAIASKTDTDGLATVQRELVSLREQFQHELAAVREQIQRPSEPRDRFRVEDILEPMSQQLDQRLTSFNENVQAAVGSNTKLAHKLTESVEALPTMVPDANTTEVAQRLEQMQASVQQDLNALATATGSVLQLLNELREDQPGTARHGEGVSVAELQQRHQQQ